jgi:ABC-type transporter Mla subunit MlaD
MATTPANLFEDLKRVLTEFKTFLDANVGTIRPAIQTLGSVVPQLRELIGQLATLLTQLKTEVHNLNPGAVAGDALAKVTEFSTSTRTLLETAKNLLPAQAAAIDQVLGALDVVGSLPSLGAIKAEIESLLDAVINHVRSLQPSA